MLRKASIAVGLTLILGVLFYDAGHTHSGRTDANGGHYNRKTGQYHYHGGGSARTKRLTRRVDTHTNAGLDTSLRSYPVETFFGDTAYRVARVIDGDTVEIQYNGRLRSVILIGVDTPETVHPNKPVEVFGKEASAFIQNLLLGESVYLRFDGNWTDSYDRLRAYLHRAPDGLFVNLEVVRQGYGKVYTGSAFKHRVLFQHYEGRAREVGKGLWGNLPAGTGSSGHQKAPSTVQQGQTEEVPRTITVYVTRTGAKYHRGSCRYLRYSKISMSLENAKRSYSACSVCRP